MILLDTHVLVWWVSNPEKLSTKAKRYIEREKDSTLVSSISVWEIYLLVKRKRLEFTIATDIWLEYVESLPHLTFIPVDNAVAATSVFLPEPFHKDPADRMIVATALIQDTAIITSDYRIRRYPHIKSIW